ncbi:hypothetical protein BCR41DRAFT_363880 [Lobosporangium transversale]|uniref:Uncharacterized protein n=1 Tax=Lobosporangium transversale TaxID=64571 RepID=A0A1Y2G8Q3_9FUNG|nr:hypothetical protein BCR41DRAFT_363880 [Lobosporangium transversale]ORY99579.1 hypothetical protein BCR41DRAFT_363880 [Lobosporangium transversale]|eukprot:XP_021875874.1 hypothetical protein BCR41DRAFT_363880 [Lobosporangium transversale]
MIKVFFIIFAASILAFAHTFLHLLWAKTIDDEDRTKNAANFPRDFPGALSATYFFMVIYLCTYYIDIDMMVSNMVLISLFHFIYLFYFIYLLWFVERVDDMTP